MNKLIELEQENAKLKEIIIELLLKQKSSQKKQKNVLQRKKSKNNNRRKKDTKYSLTLEEKMNMSLDEIIEKTHGKQYFEETKNIDEFLFE